MIRARRELIAVLQRTTGREVALRCRVTPSSITAWVAGYYRPCKRAQLALWQRYGIHPSGWVTGKRSKGYRW